MTEEDLEAFRAGLAAREDECWARLTDAVSELWALHRATTDEILACVRSTIADERRDQGSATSRSG